MPARDRPAAVTGKVLNSLSADATFSTEPYRYETATSVRRNGRRRGGGGDYGPPGPQGPLEPAGGASSEWQPLPPAPGN